LSNLTQYKLIGDDKKAAHWSDLFLYKKLHCSSYQTRASYYGQVDGFRNPMKNELKTTAVFEIISNTDAIS